MKKSLLETLGGGVNALKKIPQALKNNAVNQKHTTDILNGDITNNGLQEQGNEVQKREIMDVIKNSHNPLNKKKLSDPNFVAESKQFLFEEGLNLLFDNYKECREGIINDRNLVAEVGKEKAKQIWGNPTYSLAYKESMWKNKAEIELNGFAKRTADYINKLGGDANLVVQLQEKSQQYNQEIQSM